MDILGIIERELPLIEGAPLLSVVLIGLGAGAAWWLRGRNAAGEIAGLKAQIEGLKLQMEGQIAGLKSQLEAREERRLAVEEQRVIAVAQVEILRREVAELENGYKMLRAELRRTAAPEGLARVSDAIGTTTSSIVKSSELLWDSLSLTRPAIDHSRWPPPPIPLIKREPKKD